MNPDAAPVARQRVIDAADPSEGNLPFGLGATKPKHFREMLKTAWVNRSNLPYAWRIMTEGVCDGCALGVAGLHDWTLDGGYHLCLTRLSLLRLNTMPALDPKRLEDVAALRRLDNAALRELGRLPYPMLRRRGEPGFRRISWDDANARVGARVRAADPKRVAFFVTARGVTNEVYYVSQKVARFLGTNHVDNAARLCHAPSTGAMKHALGYAASTCSYRDWYGTDLIVFFGANPANDQPVAMKYLHEAKEAGAKVVLVNPFLEPGMRRYWVPSTPSSAVFGTSVTDWWFPVAQGGDIAFLYGVLWALRERGGLENEFIARHTSEWESISAELDRLDLAQIEARSGLKRSDFEEFAALLAGAKNAVFIWSMGITQHSFGGDAVSMVLNLGLARGYVGRPLNGLVPIRGHSSVQGGAEMGCYSTALPGGKAITRENVAALSAQYGFPVPDWAGLTAVEMVEACARSQLDVFYCVGGNFLRTLPDPDYVAQAMSRVPFRVHQDILLTDQMLLDPSDEVLLLPAKTRYEQDGGGIETSTERRVMFSPELKRQVGEARAEWRILRDLAAAAWPERAHLLGCETGEAVRAEIARVVPFYDGVQHLKKTGDAIQWGGPRLCDGGNFATPDGRAHFRAVPIPEVPVARSSRIGEQGRVDRVHPDGDPARMPATGRPASAEGFSKQTKGGAQRRLFHVSTRRGKQFNTLIYEEIDPLTGAARDAVFMHPEDAAELHLARGDRVELVSEVGRYSGRIHPVLMARGNLQVHWPEGNVLIRRGVVDQVGGVPDYNAWVEVVRA
jgi:molybdopterin-dependent oxidoreductase alpha subunit